MKELTKHWSLDTITKTNILVSIYFVGSRKSKQVEQTHHHWKCDRKILYCGDKYKIRGCRMDGTRKFFHAWWQGAAIGRRECDRGVYPSLCVQFLKLQQGVGSLSGLVFPWRRSQLLKFLTFFGSGRFFFFLLVEHKRRVKKKIMLITIDMIIIVANRKNINCKRIQTSCGF